MRYAPPPNDVSLSITDWLNDQTRRRVIDHFMQRPSTQSRRVISPEHVESFAKSLDRRLSQVRPLIDSMAPPPIIVGSHASQSLVDQRS